MKKNRLFGSIACIFLFTFSTSIFAQNAVIVNGKSIPKSKLDKLVERSGQQNSPEVREKGRELLITRELITQEAEKRGVLQREDVKEQLDQAKLSVLVAAVFEDYLATDGITDKDLTPVYDSVKGQFGGKEYKVKHILVQTEAIAKSITTRLKNGDSFESLAKEFSKDPGSASKGGDLDWVASASLVPEFSKAMSKLEKNQTTPSPVKTQFGWHIIRLEDVRDAKVPSLQELKPQLIQMLTQDQNWQKAKFGELMEKLRSKAKIQ